MKKTNKYSISDIKSIVSRLEDLGQTYLVKKAPTLPPEAKENIVKYLPYIIVVVVFLSIPSILSLIGFGSLINRSLYSLGFYYRPSFFIHALFLTTSVVLSGLSIKGLFAKKVSGWRFIYYSTLVNGVWSIISFDIGGIVIGLLLPLYILFQIQNHYK